VTSPCSGDSRGSLGSVFRRKVVGQRPSEILVREGRALAEQVARRPARANVRQRIHQQLKRRGRTTASHRLLRGYGCQITARAVAPDRDAVGVCTQIGGLAVGIFERGDRVLYSSGEPVLGRASVLDRQHSHTSVACQETGDQVVA
jgi:hypothetical protein